MCLRVGGGLFCVVCFVCCYFEVYFGVELCLILITLFDSFVVC